MKTSLFSRLSNLQSAFLIAIIVHAIPAVIWQFTQNSHSQEWNEGFDQKNLIAVDLGSFSLGGKKGGQPKSEKSDLKKSSINSATKFASTTTNETSANSSLSSSSSSSEIASGNGNGSGNGSGAGTGEGLGNGTGFSGAIQNYQEPQYPRAAIKRNLEGTIKVKINVSANGQLKSFEILQSSGHEILDNAATSAIRQWTFKPHPKNSDYFVLKTIIFSLKN